MQLATYNNIMEITYGVPNACFHPFMTFPNSSSSPLPFLLGKEYDDKGIEKDQPQQYDDNGLHMFPQEISF